MASTSKKRSSAAAGDIDNHDPSKRTKTNTAKNSVAANRPDTASKVDSNGDRYWEISKMRRATVSTFRGKKMVNIREYYEKDGQELPGKKGISMPMDQFASLITFLPEIEAVLKDGGETIPRPDYSGAGNASYEGDEGTSGGDSEDAASRKNIDATSDEDEEDE